MASSWQKIMGKTNETYTLGEWLDEWYEVYKKPNLKPYSLRNIEQVLRLYVPTELKKKPLSELRAHEIEKVLSKIPFPREKVYARQVLFSALRKAERLDFIPRNIMEAVDPVKYKKQKSKSLTIEEQREFMEKLERSRYRWLMLFYLLTGVRRCEALTIEWQDVDYGEKLIHIKGTKTAGSERDILLTEDVAAVLEEQRKQNAREREARKRGQYHKAPESIVFPFAAQQVSREFKKLCPNHHLHELRHTFITRCAESGVNINVCQQLVGHATADMTLNVYTHVMDEFKRKEAAKFTLFPKF